MSINSFKYGDFEGALDFTDYQVAERLETIMGGYQDRIKKSTGNPSYAKKVRGMVEAVEYFFDSLFGDGTAKQILRGSTSLSDAIEAFSAFVEYRAEQESATTDGWRQVADKYSPKNRAQRRAK